MKGMKRVCITLLVPEDTDKGDLATEIDAAFDDADPTVWDSIEDFIHDWQDGAV